MSWREVKPLIFKEKSSYDYGCIMLHFTFYELPTLQYKISSSHLYILQNDKEMFGFDSKPHTTLLYGVSEAVDASEVDSVLNKFKYSKCKVDNISLFENKYDVLKYDVSGSSLHESHKALSNLPHTSEYDVYKPHITIAYLKSGFGDRYVKRLKNTKFNLKPSHIMYTKPNGKEYKIDINLNNKK